MSNGTFNIFLVIIGFLFVIALYFRKFPIFSINTGTQWNTIEHNKEKLERLKIENRKLRSEISKLERIKGVEEMELE